MKPGQSVESPKSITSEFEGICKLAPVATILSPSTSKMPPSSIRSDFPSKIRAAVSAIVIGNSQVCVGASRPALHQSRKTRRQRRYILLRPRRANLHYDNVGARPPAFLSAL